MAWHEDRVGLGGEEILKGCDKVSEGSLCLVLLSKHNVTAYF